MASEEALSLDGLALNDGTTFGMVSLDAPPPRQRQDWIGAADSEAQLLFRNPLHENRKITARIVVVPQSTMDLAHDKIALIIDKLQKASKYSDPIALTWTPSTGTRTVTFDVLAGEITDLPINWEDGWLSKSPTLTIELTCKPYWRGTETLTSTTSSSTPFVTMEVTGVTGDVPALGRLIVTDAATQSRRHVEWGVEGIYYNSSTSLLVDSDNMVTSGYAGVQSTGTGAYDPGASGNTLIRASLWTAGIVAICGTGNLSHVGSFRVKARVQGNFGGDSVRLTYRAGDGPLVSNEWAEVSLAALWQEVDLGTIVIPPATLGTQRWTGQIDGLGTRAGGSTLAVDYLVLIPVLEGYGKARGSYAYTAGQIVALDQFTSTTSGVALNAGSAVLGGSWATSGSASGDFLYSDNPSSSYETVTRTATSEAGPRWGVLGTTNYTDTQVDALLYRNGSPITGAIEMGIVARWVDSSNYLRLVAKRDTATSTSSLLLVQRVAGTDTTLASVAINPTAISPLQFFALRLIVFSSGRALGWLLDSAKTASNGFVEATSTALATGGALDDGKPGLYDYVSGTLSSTGRYYDDFAVSAPAAEPIALYSGRNLQIRHDDVLRQDSTGTYSGRPQSYAGSRFLVPVGTSRVIVKARRNDIDALDDEQVLDNTQIQVGWTPRGLAIPR